MNYRLLSGKSQRSEIWKPFVSLIIPTLNEAKNLPLVLPYVPLDVVDEVILVDGRSTDNTIEVAKRLLPSIRVVLESTPGKGAALRCGYAQTNGDILIVIDADGSNDPREIPRFVQALMEGADFVKGSRFAPSGGTTDMPRLRKYGNWGFVVLVNLLFSQTFSDLCYGFHAFWRHSLNYLDLAHSNGFEVDTAIYLQAVRNKLKLVDVPSFEGNRFYGVGKLQTFPDGWRVLRTIFREWVARLKQPEAEPRIGFRNYTRSQAPHPITLIPITGSSHDDHETKQSLRKDGSEYLRLDTYLGNFRNGFSEPQASNGLSDLLIRIAETVGASSGSLIFLDDQINIVDGYLVDGRKVEPATREALSEKIKGGVAEWAIHNRQTVIIKSTNKDKRWQRQAWEEIEGVSRSALVIPFETNNQVIGVLTLTRPEERPFIDQDVIKICQTWVRAGNPVIENWDDA